MHFLLLYYKIFKTFKFNDIKKKLMILIANFFFIIITISILILKYYLKYKKIEINKLYDNVKKKFVVN